MPNHSFTLRQPSAVLCKFLPHLTHLLELENENTDVPQTEEVIVRGGQLQLRPLARRGPSSPRHLLL